jgi:heat shock protein HtpX
MDTERLTAHQLRNTLQSLLLVGAMAGLCAYLAWLIAGEPGAWLASVFVGLTYVANPVASPRLIMAIYRATPILPQQAPRLYSVLRALAERAGLTRVPTLYYLPSRLLNAFTAGGEGQSAIALSEGMLQRLSLRELAGVLAHEVSHVAHADIRVMAFADLTARLTGTLSLLGQLLLLVNLPLLLLSDHHLDWLPILVLLAAPTLSALAQLALSRNRELAADRAAAELTGDPEGLASALGKMERCQGRVLERLLSPGPRIPDPSLLRTHPPTDERIRQLLDLRERPARHGLLPLGWVERDPLAEYLGRAGQPRWHRLGVWY